MKVCVSCQADVEGKRAVPVREDRIIKIIRAIKKGLGIAQMNQLFVCEPCMPKHLERRRAFEKTMLFASVFSGLMLVIIILAPLLSGRFDAWAIISGLVVAFFILALPLFKYTPAVEGISASGRPAGTRKQPSGSVSVPPAPAPSPPSPLPVAPAQKKTKAKKAKSRR